MFDLIKIKVEKIFGDINAQLKAYVPIDVSIDVDKHKTEIETETLINAESVVQADTVNQLTENKTTNIGQLTIIAGQSQNVLPPALAEILGPQLPAPVDSVGAQLPAPEDADGKKCEKRLQSYLEEHGENPEFFLGVGQLFQFHGKHSTVDFSKEQLVFLLQSSLKNGFPFWYWSLVYREKFSHVVPLLKQAYKTPDVKIRMEVIRVLGQFRDTANEIVKLCESEENEMVLGKAIAILVKSKADDDAQRVISNGLSRKIIPKVEYKDIEKLNAPLGINEKKLLIESIDKGWPEDIVWSLNLLSASPSEPDLAVIEDVLEKVRYTRATVSALHCIERIKKTNRPELVRTLLADTRQEDVIYQTLKTITALKDRESLPALYEWAKKPESSYWRFSEVNTWKFKRLLDKAIQAAFTVDFYEHIIDDILSSKFYGKNWGLFTWRQRHLLQSIENDEVKELIKKETRLAEMPEWSELVEEIDPKEVFRKDAREEDFIGAINPTNYEVAEAGAKKLWQILSIPEILAIRSNILLLRKDLEDRLDVFREDDNLTEDERELAKSGLNRLLGNNRYFYLLARDIRKKRADSGEEKKEKAPLDLLLSDISHFENIESSFIDAVLKKKLPENEALVLDFIGKPYDRPYEAITTKWPESNREELKEKLQALLKDEPNPILKISILGALLRLGAIDKDEARINALMTLIEVRKELKSTARSGDDKWIVYEIAYGSCANFLSELGHVEDMDLIEESIERDVTVSKAYWRYGGIFDHEAMKKLIEIQELATKSKERESARNTLEALDNNWSEALLEIDKSEE